ncbi:hypothetical protein CF95_gp195 [Erwinia phage PhiEaH1]|jgi:hypothetical protein|uniref:Uncharacterized protein n=1 Tax=Erwinia phage PhiEaH1 TaxID=1401669 RepID=W8CZG4_9CAUD|nr:hypothetical protein CF95_gp195 [Erwinia phage PhiEaH1]AGX01917.1 hypothetical protein [Erwinia phage PhiEaH1]
MFEKLEAAVGSKVLYGVIWIATLTFTYWFGGHIEKEKTTAVDSAVSSVSTQLGTILTNQINTQVGGINARLLGDTNAINLILQGGFKNNDDADARLHNLTNAGVYVKASPGTPGETKAAGTAAAGPGNNATYRAQLSDQARDFFAGEAKRANQCAVQLKGAQDTLLSWQRAVDEYNRTVADPNGYDRVQLPDKK